MKFSQLTAESFVPDGVPVEEALARTTHMCMAAHQDDIEIMAPSQILTCFGKPEKWFAGVVVTNGAGSPRSAHYAEYTDDEMQSVRKLEQRKAAVIGEYGFQGLLDHPSAKVKTSDADDVRADIKRILSIARPEVLIIHNLMDKHDTHVALTLRIIEAIREMPTEERPASLFGGEVWRDLDWVLDDEKLLWDVSDRENLLNALVAVFDSQISGGKRYDLAAAGRRCAHATYQASHHVDNTKGTCVGVDFTPLIKDDKLDVTTFAQGFVDRFKTDVGERIGKYC